MLLTVKAKLQPSGEQRTKLHTTMQTFNAACTDISKTAYETKTYNKYKLQHTLYHRVREQYRLPAQLAIRAISKVVESYRTERRNLHTFNPYGAIVYDQRLLSFKGLDRVSLTTLEGRVVVPILVGGYAKLDQRKVRGQADLIYVKGEFYLCVAVETPKETPLKPDGVLGVDFGIVNIASTSDGVSYSGERCEETRVRYAGLKAALQHVGSKSARRHLRSVAGREARFKRCTNHVISKQIVGVAKGTKRAVALEDLKGIRTRTTVRHGQRDRASKWAYNQLRAFIEYKAKLAGVPVLLVDPRNTSRRCSVCGHTEKGNRPSRAVFRCRACGYSGDADLNGAENIRWRAEVNQPIVSSLCEVFEAQGQAHLFRGG